MKVVKTKEDIIKDIAIEHNKTVGEIKGFYNSLESIVFDTLSSTSEEQPVCVRLFEGISLNGEYTQEKTKKNNLTGKMKVVSSRIKPKCNITRSYCEKLNSKM